MPAMFDAEFFKKGLPLQVAGYGGWATVRLQTSGKDYLVRDVIKTYEGGRHAERLRGFHREQPDNRFQFEYARFRRWNPDRLSGSDHCL